ncbi:tail fiber domain-containing protein [Levilactobacillus brevis]|uniref:tail fiber domain-containing protein n=1 Tax=Levilactobacillus brevis TaxID=1580 RepID=UPI0020737899|nr:tail fiber domain-containing protein [Levilactobacillus brevis]
MIIATGSVDINEATKIAQIASDSASDLADKMKNTVATMDGKTTVSTSTPFNDGKEHNEGDMWTVINDDVASAMYIYTSGEWKAKKWDQQALSVKQLSALTADLGHVTAGTLESAIINGAQINGGSISINSGVDNFKMDKDGFEASNLIDGDTTNIYGGMISLARGNTGTITLDSVHGINSKGLSISGHTIACDDSGALYLEKQGGGGSVTDIHAADVYSNGTKLKSALSAKRDVTEYSPDEALSAVMNTDVKKWKYKDSDNSADSQHIGPIIDDVNSIGKKSASIANDMISTDENGNYFLNESNTISILLAALKKSNQRIDELSYRITKLERNNAQ